MWRYLIRRLLELVPTLIGVSIAVFLFIHAIPGDPARLAAGQDATMADIQAMRARLGLNHTLPVQYLYFVRNALHGDFGLSFRQQVPVLQVIKEHFLPTLLLSTSAIVIAFAFGLLAGVLAATRRNSMADLVITAFSAAGISIPSFFLGILLIYLFAVNLHWFPVTGSSSVRGLVLPSVSLALAPLATIARFVRSSFLEVAGEDFVRTASSKGLGYAAVTYKHALRNALIPVVTMTGLQFGFLLGGAVVIETVFNYTGLGWLLIQSIGFRDYPVLQVLLLVFALEFMLVNLIVDLTYGALDPRIRYG
ncbi:MAG: ABC transporter permease [Deinococcales bacterium]